LGWLSDETHERWMMVVDNIDHGIVLFEPLGNGSAARRTIDRSLSDCISQSSNWAILVTSRSRAVTCRLIGRSHDIVDVGAMDGEDEEVALALLQKKLDKQIRDTHEDNLIRLVRQPVK
jgi:hypothetical protein